MAGTPELGCQGYRIDRRVDNLVRVQVDFVLKIAPKESILIADALSRLETYLAGSVNLVRGGMDRRPRCFYCAVLNDETNTHCASCGAPL